MRAEDAEKYCRRGPPPPPGHHGSLAGTARTEPRCVPPPVRGCLPGRDQRSGAGCHRGARTLPRRGGKAGDRSARNRHDRIARHDRNALPERAGPLHHHARLHRRYARLFRPPDGLRASRRCPHPPSGGHQPRAGTRLHGAQRGLSVHARAPGRRRASAHQRRTHGTPHHPGLGGSSTAPLHPRRRRDQQHRRVRAPVSGSGRSREDALLRRDHRGCASGLEQEQRQHQRRNRPARAGSVARPRTRPSSRHRGHPLHRHQGIPEHARLSERSRPGAHRRRGPLWRHAEGRLHGSGRRHYLHGRRRQRQGNCQPDQAAGRGDQRQQYAARRPENCPLLRPLRTRGRCFGDDRARAGRGHHSGRHRPVPLPWRSALFPHRRRYADPDSRRDFPRHGAHRHERQSHVPRRTRHRHRPHGGRLRRHRRERIRAARPPEGPTEIHSHSGRRL